MIGDRKLEPVELMLPPWSPLGPAAPTLSRVLGGGAILLLLASALLAWRAHRRRSTYAS